MFGSKSQCEKLNQSFPVNILGNLISPIDAVRNLGVWFDSDFSFSCHVMKVCKACFAHVRDVKRLRGHLTHEAALPPFLHKLHWLPIHYRILFKYNLLIYKAIHLSQPPYLSALIRRSDLTRGNRLSISSSKPNKRSGLRSFIAGAPTEWNKLPQAIRTIESISGFRKQLKTYLFRLAYPPP